MGKGLPRSHSRGVFTEKPIVKLNIPLNGLVVNVDAVSTAIGWGTSVIRGLPEGNLLFLGAVANLQFSGSGADANLADTWAGDYAIGTAPTADLTLAGAEVDIIPSTALAAATAEVSPITRGESTANAVMFDNTDGSLELNLQVLIDAADIVDDENVDLTVEGLLSIAFIVLGDD